MRKTPWESTWTAPSTHWIPRPSTCVWSLFPWARFRARKGAVKMHTLLDVRGSIPTFIEVTDGKVHDVNILDQILPEADSFYVMDRAYVDFERLYVFHQCAAFFVVRSKSGIRLRRRYSHPVDKTTGVLSDHTVVLESAQSAKHYPVPLRRIRYHDPEHDLTLVFLTNNFDLPAITIALLYKSRWQVELFFENSTWCTPFNCSRLTSYTFYINVILFTLRFS